MNSVRSVLKASSTTFSSSVLIASRIVSDKGTRRFLSGGKKLSRRLEFGRVQSLKGDLPIDDQEVELRIRPPFAGDCGSARASPDEYEPPSGGR